MNNAILFDFQGEPPAPFDTLDSPRLTEPQYLSVYNGYGEKQVSTLSPALISAIHVYLDLKKAAVNGGVGKSDQCTFAEYQSAAGEIRLAKYNKIKGVLSYGIYKQGALFPCLEETFDPLVLCLALLPPLLDDHEFCTKFEAYERDVYKRQSVFLVRLRIFPEDFIVFLLFQRSLVDFDFKGKPVYRRAALQHNILF